MNPVIVTFRRTLGFARNLFSTAFSVGAFLSAVAALFACRLADAEGSQLTLSAVWVSAAGPILPLLAACLGMETWSDDFRTGRIETLLSTSIRERDVVLGKFLGVLAEVAIALALSLCLAMVTLAFLAPSALEGETWLSPMPGFVGLLVQGTLWTAVSAMASACCRQAAMAAVLSVTLTTLLPRALWFGLMMLSSAGRTAFGEYPIDAHAYDAAVGSISIAALFAYLSLTVLAMFIASNAIAMTRFIGRGSRRLRASSRLACLMALVAVALAIPLVQRFDFRIEFPVGVASSSLSSRTRGVLAEADGTVVVTAFISRHDPRFRTTSNFLRIARDASASVGGCRLELRFVDPKWDVGAAGRLVRLGAEENSLVFERGRRVAHVAIDGSFGERVFASAVRRVALPPPRRNVYWTCGHGERAYDAYDTWGMSDIARELAREGYVNARLDLTSADGVPGDCALVVVAGAREEFSRAELSRVDKYLKAGGRMLVLSNGGGAGGVASILPSWGLRLSEKPIVGARTISGTDVIVDEFAAHVVSASIAGSQLVLERPVSFEPSGVAENGSGADRIEYTAAATVNGRAVAAVISRGTGAGNDLALRPTRIVAVGDATFVANGPLKSMANANRDFFLNCVSYLSGADTIGGTGEEVGRLVTGMDRDCRLRHALVSSVVLPLVVLLLLAIPVMRRRNRP